MADDAQPYTEAELAVLFDCGTWDRLSQMAPIALRDRLKATLAARDRRISELEAAFKRLVHCDDGGASGEIWTHCGIAAIARAMVKG